jgi:dynein heavy chain
MNRVLFNDAQDHLIRIHRILQLPRCNALLVGVGGSSKASPGSVPSQPRRDVPIALSKHYSEQNFREDLKQL